MPVPPVLRELREVLKETRQPPGKEAVAGYDAVSANYPAGGENAVRRFEKEDTAPAYDNIDAMVNAYAEATRTSVFDLWDEAIDRARKAPPVEEVLPTVPGDPARTAKQEADRKAAELKKRLDDASRTSRTSRQRSSTSKRGSGKK